MRQADASDVSESARVKSRKPTAPLRMTRTIRAVLRPSSGSRPSSELWITQANAPDVFKSIHVTTSTVAPYRKPTAPLKMTRTIRIVPSSELWIQQTNTTDDYELVSVRISSVAVI
eukprot:4666588-Pyramimonas_sp.AAC.1